VRHARRCRARKRKGRHGLWTCKRLDGRLCRTALDAVCTGVLWVHRSDIERFPHGIDFRVRITIDVTIANGGNRALELIVVLGIQSCDVGVR
jgi:hypothetical protein